MIKQEYEVRGFPQGLNNRDASVALKPGETPDCQNMIFDERGAMCSRPGFVKDIDAKVAPNGSGYDDFSMQSLGVPLGWTEQWAPAGQQWGVIEKIGATGNKVLQHTKVSTDDQTLITFDACGSVGNGILEAKISVPALISGNTQYLDIFSRASGVIGNKNGYSLSIIRNIGDINFQLNRWQNNVKAALSLETFLIATEDSANVRVKFQLDGAAIKVRVWVDFEPELWQLDVVDAAHAAGWVGFGTGVCAGTQEFDYLQVTSLDSTEKVTSIYEFNNRAGNSYFLAAAGKKLCVNAAGAWNPLKSNFTDGRNFSIDTNMLVDKALLVNGIDGYFETNGITLNAVTPYIPTFDEIVEFGYNGLGNYTGFAELETDLAGYNNDLKFTARVVGAAGALISIRYVDPAVPSAAISVSVAENAITVNLATDAGSLITSTAINVLLKISNHATAKGLVRVDLKSGNDGTGVVTTMAATNLVGSDIVIPATITKPQLLCYHKYRTWFAIDDRVYYCGTDIRGNILYNYFPVDNWLRSANSKGETITAIVPYKTSIYVFTKTTVKVIMGDVPSEFVMYEVDNNSGTVAHRTVKEINGYLFFLGVDGVYIFNGQGAPTKISVRIPKTIRSINTLYRHLAAAIAYQGSFFISVPESSDNDLHLYYDTDVVVKDYEGKEYGYVHNPWTVMRGFDANDWLLSKDENLYAASSDGYVYVYGAGDKDDTKDIEAYFDTKAYNINTNKRKWFKEVWVYTEPGLTGPMVVQYKIGDEEWVDLQEIRLESRADGVFFRNINRYGHTITFRFKNKFSSRIKVYGFIIVYAVQGSQVGKASKE